MRFTRGPRLVLFIALIWATTMLAPVAYAHPDAELDDPTEQSQDGGLHAHQYDPSAALSTLDAVNAGIISSGPNAKVIKNLSLSGRGPRLVANATTDVWAHDGYAYTGTFNSPCGGDPNAGIWVWNVKNKNKPSFVGIIASPVGSRTNDVKVAAMNGGDILVHSNEACAGGPGGFEIYNVDDPKNPVHLAHVQTDDVNPVFRSVGFVDVGVHNLFLFTRDGRDYVAAQVEGRIGDFQVFDITDPSNATLAKYYTPADIILPGIDWTTETDLATLVAAQTYLLTGFGASQNRLLHDHYITPDGQRGYLANWDAGLLLVELGELDGGLASFVSQAIDPTSEDGEVNSHSVWPNEDETIVIEGEEDFAPFESIFAITSGPNAGGYPSAEGAITVPIGSLPGAVMAGPTVYVGGACNPGTGPGFDDPVPVAPTGDSIALIQRGVCSFTQKVTNADTAGYAGVVVFNDAARGDALVTMGGTAVNLPGVFVGHSTGLAIAGVASAGDLVLGAAGADVSAATIPNGWSGVRIWDYSDPTAPVLAATFNTVCSSNPVDASCDPGGTYSSHNVIVETTGNTVKAYISWYSDGMLVLDITDPYNPVEVARYFDNSSKFLATNGGQPHSFWGVYKEKNSPWIYGSDRNGGLYVFKELGSGTIGKK